MSVSYRVIAAHELDAGLVAAWRSIQEREPRFESPYFCPEFTRAVGAVRDDVRVVVIENDGRPAGFFPHQRAAWGRGSPVGGPVSDYHGVIAASDADNNGCDLWLLKNPAHGNSRDGKRMTLRDSLQRG